MPNMMWERPVGAVSGAAEDEDEDEDEEREVWSARLPP